MGDCRKKTPNYLLTGKETNTKDEQLDVCKNSELERNNEAWEKVGGGEKGRNEHIP